MRKIVQSQMHPEYRLGVHRYDCELTAMLKRIRKQNKIKSDSRREAEDVMRKHPSNSGGQWSTR
uniref:Uncharacterized protein n=1 Tax=viral metagenome TaxID=1070528 RepID=A0A6M3IGC2_9ZZZZ